MSESELNQFSRNLSLRWFEVHAEQRMKMMNFFIVVSGFCIAGFFAALQAKNPLAASVVGVVLLFVAICFKQLDRRSAQLVRIAEESLKSALRPLAECSGSQDIVTLSGERGSVPSYRQTFNALFALFGLLGLAGAFFPWLAVSFQEVVHSGLTEEAEVAEASDSEGRTEWTPIRMRL